ncbi:MAG: hypothetical protein NTV21_14865 [Planctomycetota bacterium]|nr:hypothetical protein [Planctomycetota bacterium]
MLRHLLTVSFLLSLALVSSSAPQQAYLKASNPDTGDHFGSTLSMDGDTLVVGAPREMSGAVGINGNAFDDSLVEAGAAYVYVRTGSGWSLQAYIKASNTGAYDQFGHSVAVSGDTLVVGAPQERSNATGVNGNQGDDTAYNSGAAYVFVRNGATWTQQAYLKASNTDIADFFGERVSIDGDTIVVGARAEDGTATGVNGSQSSNGKQQSGAAYVFVRNGTTWSQQAYLKASNTDAGDYFGCSVAISGDTIAVGAQSEASAATGVNGNQADNSVGTAGAVYVFVRNGTTWAQQAYIKSSNTETQDLFGCQLALDGGTLAVSAEDDSAATGINGDQADNSARDSGAVHVFVRSSGGNWTQQAYIKSANSEERDFFGGGRVEPALALSGSTLVVGASFEDSAARGVDGDPNSNSAMSAGAAYVFTRHGSIWRQSAYVKATNTDPDDRFGVSVALDGRILAVGAQLEAGGSSGVGGDQGDNSVGYSGAAYAYGLDLDHDEFVLAAGATKIVKLDAFDGHLLDANFIVDANSATTYDFRRPWDAVQVGEQIWITDADADSIFRFDRHGQWIGTIGPVAGRLDDPRGACFANGTVYVVNRGSSNAALDNSLTRFTPDGQWLGAFGVSGFFVEPSDVLERSGELLISLEPDFGGPRIDRRSYLGGNLGAFVSATFNGTQVDKPQQLSLTSTNNVLAAGSTGLRGIYEYSQANTIAAFHSFGSALYGVFELGNGERLISDPAIKSHDSASSAVTVLHSSANARSFGYFRFSNGPTIYCSASTSTNGCVASIGAWGSPSVAASEGYQITVADVEGQKQGLIFYGLSGPKSSLWAPGSTSYLCVKSPTQRTVVQNSGGTAGACNGTLVLDFLDYIASHPAAIGAPLNAGQVVYTQAWFRDPAAPGTTNLSNALHFTLAP